MAVHCAASSEIGRTSGGAAMNGAANFGILFRYFGFRYLNWVLASIIGLTATVTLIQAIELALSLIHI